MPKLPRVNSAATVRALERLGFIQVRQRGSHLILKKQEVVDIEFKLALLLALVATIMCRSEKAQPKNYRYGRITYA